MDVNVDHYVVLGLPSGEEGAKLLKKDIKKAYRLKALELHPDKRPHDPNAEDNFKKLQTSYDVLKDEKARKDFDNLLRVKREKLQRQSQQHSKRRKMMSDLEENERASFAPDASVRARGEEDRSARKLKEEITRIRAMQANKGAPPTSMSKKKTMSGNMDTPNGDQTNSDKEKVLRVSWKKSGGDYTAQRLRELFEVFGEVEDIVISRSKKQGSALIVMATKDAAVTATGNVSGDLSNPLSVQPLRQALSTISLAVNESTEFDVPKLNNLVGAEYQEFEDSVLKKLQRVYSTNCG